MGVVIAVFGALFAGAGAVKIVRMATVQSRGRRAVGRVVRLEVIRDAEGDLTYAPVVEFGAGDRKWEVKGWASFPPGCQVGQEVAVYYPPGCPEKARIVSRREWWIAWCFLAGGAMFVVFGAAVALR